MLFHVAIILRLLRFLCWDYYSLLGWWIGSYAEICNNFHSFCLLVVGAKILLYQILQRKNNILYLRWVCIWSFMTTFLFKIIYRVNSHFGLSKCNSLSIYCAAIQILNIISLLLCYCQKKNMETPVCFAHPI